MSSSQHAILDLGGEEDLQFTKNEFKPSTSKQEENMTSFPDPGSPSSGDRNRLIGDDGEGETRGGYSGFWTMSFYQQFFDVDDVDVQKRLLYSMVPIPGKSFLQHHIRPRPDLYGPFWICATLIFSIAVSGNLANYFQTSLDGKAAWHYDFHKVSLASTAVFSYASLLPAGLYCYLWWASKGAEGMAITFLELLCLYGYSLTIYIPVSVLWLIPVNWLQWIFVLAGAGLSGAVLFTTVWPAIRESAAKSAIVVMVVILVLHLLLATGFMLYFFHVPSQAGGDSPLVTTTQVVPVKNDTVNLGKDEKQAADEAKPAEPSALYYKKDTGAGQSQADTGDGKKDPAAVPDQPQENASPKKDEDAKAAASADPASEDKPKVGDPTDKQKRPGQSAKDDNLDTLKDEKKAMPSRPPLAAKPAPKKDQQDGGSASQADGPAGQASAEASKN